MAELAVLRDILPARIARAGRQEAALLAAVFAAGYVLNRMHLPASWLIGSMVVSAVFAMRQWSKIDLPPNLYLLIQSVIGISLAGSFSPSSLTVLLHHWLPVTLVVVLMMLFTIVNALYLLIVAKVDAATAMLGSLPGGAGEMTAISASFGADPRLVSVIQYVRLLIIILSVSLISHAAGRVISTYHISSVQAICQPLRPALAGSGNLPLCLIVAVAGGWLGTISRIPAGTLLLTMIFSLLLSAFGQPISWPMPVLAFAYTTMGLMIGSRFDKSTLDELKRLCTPLLLTTISLMIGSVLLAILFTCLMPINALSSYLAATPGGLDSIAVMASELHADATVVLTVHFLRLMLVLAFGPTLVTVFAKYCNKWRISKNLTSNTYTGWNEEPNPTVCQSPVTSAQSG